MKRIGKVLHRIRGWAQGFADAIQASNLEPRQLGTDHGEMLVIFTPLAPAVIRIRREGNDSSRTAGER